MEFAVIRFNSNETDYHLSLSDLYGVPFRIAQSIHILVETGITEPSVIATQFIACVGIQSSALQDDAGDGLYDTNRAVTPERVDAISRFSVELCPSGLPEAMYYHEVYRNGDEVCFRSAHPQADADEWDDLNWHIDGEIGEVVEEL